MGFVITSSIHWSALTIFCSHVQCNSTFVSVSLSPRGCVFNIKRLEGTLQSIRGPPAILCTAHPVAA